MLTQTSAPSSGAATSTPQIAYLHCEARRVAAQIATEVRAHQHPGDRITFAVLGAVRTVRETPVLAAWFVPGRSGATAALATAFEVIESPCSTLFGVPAADERARWLVRVVLSLLSAPGQDADDEERMLRRFVVPAVLSQATDVYEL